MFIRRVLFLMVLLPLAVGALAQPTSPITCPDALPSRLLPGNFGRVTPGDANRVRDMPSTDGGLVGEIPGEGEFLTLAGPVCADGFAWWYVQHESQFGWTVEGGGDYWLEPTEPVEIDFERPAGEIQTFSFNNISFRYDDSVITGEIEASIVPAKTEEDGYWGLEIAPEHTLFILNGYVTDPDRDWAARMRVYPAEEYEALLGIDLEPLRTLHSDRPAEPSFQPLTPINAAFIHNVHNADADFANGRGVRAVVHFAQNTNLLTDQGLWYQYTGLTNDGAYFVDILAELNSDRLPPLETLWSEAVDFQTFTTDYYSVYTANAAPWLETFPADSFTPTLGQMDALVASIDVGAVGMVETESVDGTTCQTLRPRLIVDEFARQAMSQDSLRVRDEPGGAATGENVFPGQLVSVLDGPACVDNVNWWQVESADGWTGWVAEAVGDNTFFDPVTRTPTPTMTFTPSPVPPTATRRPYVTRTPFPPTGCTIYPFAQTNARSLPDPESNVVGRFEVNDPLYVGAQYERPGEGFVWWRVVHNTRTRSNRLGWIREDFVREEGNCEQQPFVDPYND